MRRHAIHGAVLAAMVLAAPACGPQSGRSEVPTRPQRLVLVVGTSADALGIEQSRDPQRDAIEVALHDGTTTWVESARVRDLALVPGSRVVVRWAGRLQVTTLVEHVDRMAWVGVADGPHLVGIADVVAVLRRTEVVGALPTGISHDHPHGHPRHPTTSEAAPAAIDPARVVAVDGASMWAVARVARCSADSATVSIGTGSPIEVPLDRVAALAIDAGARVWAPWQNGTYPALVIETRSGMAHLQWDDHSDAWMPIESLRRVLAPAPAGRRGRPSACNREMTPALVHIGRQRVAGTLEECAEGRATITRADRTSDHRTISEVSVLSLAAGDPVEARWRDEAVYPATVVAVDGSSLRVRWEDGSEEPISLAAVVSAVEPVGANRPRVPPTCR